MLTLWIEDLPLLPGALEHIVGTHYVEAATCPVFMMNRSLAHWSTQLFYNFWLCWEHLCFGYKGGMKIWRLSQEGAPHGTYNLLWGDPGPRTLGMVSEWEELELADSSSLSECLFYLSYRTNYERTQRKEKTHTLSLWYWHISWTEHTEINWRTLLPSSNCKSGGCAFCGEPSGGVSCT